MAVYDDIEWNDTAASRDDIDAGGCELLDHIVRASNYTIFYDPLHILNGAMCEKQFNNGFSQDCSTA